MKKKIYAFIVLALVMAFVAGPTASVQAASTKGYHKGEESWAYIQLIDATTDEASAIFHPQGVKCGMALSKMKGLSYNKKTNTLTMKNFKQPNLVLDINEMGSDFKIKLVGKNQVNSITVGGLGYAGCVELTGSGTLIVNKSKSACEAFTFNAENSAAVLKVGKKAKLYAYAGEESGYSVRVLDSTVSSVSKTFVFNGRKSTKNVEKTTEVLYERIEKGVKLSSGISIESLYTLTKSGKTYWGFVFPGDYENEFYICKETGEDWVNGLEIVEIIEQITEFNEDPFTDNGYSYNQTSSVCHYLIKGNLIIK